VLGSNDNGLPPEIAGIGGHPRIESVKNTHAGQMHLAWEPHPGGARLPQSIAKMPDQQITL
jgi:hypothetical protein